MTKFEFMAMDRYKKIKGTSDYSGIFQKDNHASCVISLLIFTQHFTFIGAKMAQRPGWEENVYKLCYGKLLSVSLHTLIIGARKQAEREKKERMCVVFCCYSIHILFLFGVT